jgi:hypothetical protein
VDDVERVPLDRDLAAGLLGERLGPVVADPAVVLRAVGQPLSVRTVWTSLRGLRAAVDIPQSWLSPGVYALARTAWAIYR